MSDSAALGLLSLSSMGSSSFALLCCCVVCLFFGNGSKLLPVKCTPKSSDCAYTTRINVNGRWQCPPGYEDNGCSWNNGPDLAKLQCKACGANNPYRQYQISNPNCPAGFIPCNRPPFNYGDLKKNDKGEFYYPDGWGVDAPDYDWNQAATNLAGGAITLNVGKFGGTDAHPEVFAKGCCAWGNSTADPERDKANKAIKIATTVVSAAIDVAAALAAP
ncbi:hypothetical protein EBT31_22170, partial [bacterium]|nr:hypothetical protein [bacterium]